MHLESAAWRRLWFFNTNIPRYHARLIAPVAVYLRGYENTSLNVFQKCSRIRYFVWQPFLCFPVSRVPFWTRYCIELVWRNVSSSQIQVILVFDFLTQSSNMWLVTHFTRMTFCWLFGYLHEPVAKSSILKVKVVVFKKVAERYWHMPVSFTVSSDMIPVRSSVWTLHWVLQKCNLRIT